MTLILASINIILSLNFIQIKHPLAIGLILLLQTIVIRLICGLFTHSYWFAYILFLIILGGILVLFIYVTRLASNELFSFSIKNFIVSIIIIIFMITTLIFIDSSIRLINNIEILPLNPSYNILTENEFSLIKLYNNPTINITIIIINYLLLTLIVVVKITNINYGPLRQSFIN